MAAHKISRRAFGAGAVAALAVAPFTGRKTEDPFQRLWGETAKPLVMPFDEEAECVYFISNGDGTWEVGEGRVVGDTLIRNPRNTPE